METRNLRKVRQGVVISNKMDKTIVIAAKFKEMHPIYGKFVQKTKKYHAHDENCIADVGLILLVMCVVFLCLLDELTINRVLLLELSCDNNGFIHLVANYDTLSCFS